MYYVDNGKVELVGKAVGGEKNELLSTASSEYESIDRYVVTMTTDDGRSLRFVLHRLPRTAIWRVAEIRLPLPDEASC